MEDLKELDFSKLETIEQIEEYVKEKLGVDMLAVKGELSAWVQNKAEELTLDFTNIAPYAEYDKMLEDNDSMADFLKAEATKPENWLLRELQVVKHAGQNMLEFIFGNKAVDDGDSLEGYAFVSMTGKIRHTFAQCNGKA